MQQEKCHEKYTNLIKGRNSYVYEREEYTPELRPIYIPTEPTGQLTEFLGASMSDFTYLLGNEPIVE